MSTSILLKVVMMLGGIAIVGGTVLLGWRARPPSFTITQSSSEELSDWKIYQNQVYGYQIQFPQDFTVRIQSNTLQYIQHKFKHSNTVEVSVALSRVGQDDYKPVELNDVQSFFLFVDNDSDESIYQKQYESYSKQHIKFNGYDAVLLHDKKWGAGNKIYLYHNNLVFIIFYTAFDEYKPVIEKILATFAFVH